MKMTSPAPAATSLIHMISLRFRRRVLLLFFSLDKNKKRPKEWQMDLVPALRGADSPR